MAAQNCRQSLRLSVEDFAVLFYDDTRNRKSKKANADGMY